MSGCVVTTPRYNLHMTTFYSLGFAFSPDHSRVLLIKKTRPEWQAGLLNGVGGKVEQDESTHDAMVREFKEETNIDTVPENWAEFGLHSGPGYELRLFSTTLTFAQCKQLERTTDEKPGWFSLSELGSLLKSGVPGSAMYVCMALNHMGRSFFTTTKELP